MSAAHRVAATVLYEDSRGNANVFGLHELMVACVFDEIDGDRWQLGKRLDASPKKGSGPLLRSVQKDSGRITADGRHAVYIFDDDRIRPELKMPQEAPECDVIQAIRGRAPPDAKTLSIVLLKRNMETVVAAAGRCDPSTSLDTLDRAITKKDRVARDSILTRVAWAGTRQVRECILREVPSLQELRDVLIRIVQSDGPTLQAASATSGA